MNLNKYDWNSVHCGYNRFNRLKYEFEWFRFTCTDFREKASCILYLHRQFVWRFHENIHIDVVWFSTFFSSTQIKYTQRSTIIDGIGANADDYEYFLRFHKPVKPDDQLDLTEAELAEDITKHLDTDHKNYAQNLVVYSFKDYAYVPVRWSIVLYLNLRKKWWFWIFARSFHHHPISVYCSIYKGIQYPSKMETMDNQ